MRPDPLRPPPIAGANGASFRIAAVELGHGGSYHAVASNAAGTATSSSAQVNVSPRAENAGIYFGTIGGDAGGKFALVVNPDGSALLIGYAVGQQNGFTSRFTVSRDGTFNAIVELFKLRAASAARLSDSGPAVSMGAVTATLAGRLSTGAVEASFSTGETLTGTSSGTGAAGSLAGAYFAPLVNSGSAAVYSIVGSDGRVLVVSKSDSGGVTAEGTVQSNGQFTASGGGGIRIDGTITPANGSVSGQLAGMSDKPAAFSGLNTSVPRTDRLINISTRAHTAAGANVLIAGFVVEGTSPKPVLIRGVGPALRAFGVTAAVANPSVTLYRGETVLATNDNWVSDQATKDLMASVGAFGLDDASADAVLSRTLEPGNYTVHVASDTATGGVALVEVYDAAGEPGSADPTKLINISSRAFVGTDQQQLIAGFVVTGNTPRRVLVRAVGPALSALGVAGALQNPKLTLTSPNGVVAENDDWGGSESLVTAFSSAGAFGLPASSKDAALITTLVPGQYTVVISGVGGGTGVALAEVYALAD